MTPVWDNTMSDQSAKELLALLESRTKRTSFKDQVDIFKRIAEGEYGDHYSPDSYLSQEALGFFNEVMDSLVPPHTTLKEEFWNTNAGQLLAAVEYWLYGADTIPVAEAAKALYGNSENNAISSTLRLIERGKLQAIHRSESTYVARRKTSKTGQGTNRSRLVIKSSLDAYLKERV